MMLRLLLMTLIVASVGGAALAKMSEDIEVRPASVSDYILVDVDKSILTSEDVIELHLDVQFDLENTNSDSKTRSGDVVVSGVDRARDMLIDEESGYKIAIRLPMTMEWRAHGEQLKIRIQARTAPQSRIGSMIERID